jgi:hypothetical protein
MGIAEKGCRAKELTPSSPCGRRKSLLLPKPERMRIGEEKFLSYTQD